MMSKISQTHPCSGKCKRFNGEPCKTCLITEPESDFMIGDQVVYLYTPFSPVYTVKEIVAPHGMLYLANRSSVCNGTAKPSSVRCATLEEISAGHRIDSNSPEFEGVENQRPDCLFEKEPTARDAIMEFMRFSGNAKPYCAACIKKEYDMRVLRTLHAENTYALEKKIRVRNIIIAVLVVIIVLLAVALAGAL